MVEVAVGDDHAGDASEWVSGAQDGFVVVGEIVWAGVDHGEVAGAVADEVGIGAGEGHRPRVWRNYTFDQHATTARQRDLYHGELNVAVVEDAHRHARQAPVHPGRQVATAAHVPAPRVPGTDHRLPVERALGQRPAIMRTVVVDRVQAAVDVDQRVPALAGLHGEHLAWREVAQLRDGDVLALSTRQEPSRSRS